MGSCSRRRHQEVQLLLGLAFLILVLGQCQGSRAAPRNSNVFKIKKPPPNDNPQNLNHFLNFLPRGLPFPYSGPSRKHNGIGLESWSSSRHPTSSSPSP
ncbi:hypothetical protein CRG98_037381 [Punica granatum]|uniref:Protein IDA-LIKE 2-like n=1 Tax=Punica granatum TaxID=22663 RepID=A0A2I0IE22_PUNGR|nr:hypothetical protein CRG98_037381 [Punica granatum]